MVGLWVVKTIHSKVRYGGVKLLVYLSWCCVSHWLSWKLSSSDSSNTGQKGRCGCMHILLTCAVLRKTVQKMHAYWMLPFPTSAFLCFLVAAALYVPRSPSSSTVPPFFANLPLSFPAVLRAFPLAPPLPQPLSPVPTMIFRLAPSRRFFV